MIPTVQIVGDVPARAAELFGDCLLGAVRDRGRFTTALPGGGTPRPMYRLLADRPDLPWDRAHVFVGDERFVPEVHPDSNFGAIRDLLLDHVPIPADHVHPWPILEEPESSAEAYAATLDSTLRGMPLDLVLLGLGRDGHTAGIFPGTGKAGSGAATVVSRPEGQEHTRLSMTPRRLAESRVVAFLVAGAEKREALDALLADEGDRERYPGRAIAALEQLLVITDLAP